MTTERLIASQEALALQRSPAFAKALADARQNILKVWESSRTTEEREQAWYTIQALDHIRLALSQSASEAMQEEVKAKGLHQR